MSIKKAREVLKIESEAIASLIKRIGKDFAAAIQLIFACRGKVIVAGAGKSGIIGQKISATLASTGTPSFFLHPSEALHGNLGIVSGEDVVIVLSNSGETEEIVQILPPIKKIGAKIISLVGNKKSTLARKSDIYLDVSVKKEAGPLGLAPTSSTVAMLAMGDALAMALLDKKGFRAEDFALNHPGGSLGKKLRLKVNDVMRIGPFHPLVKGTAKIKQVLFAITRARAGSATVVDGQGKLIGIFTDGDLRRHLEKDPHLLERPVKEVMSKTPVAVTRDKMALEVLKMLQAKKIDEIVVVDDKNRAIGLVDVQDLLKAGLV